MIYRVTDNPEQILYFQHLRNRPTVGMPIWKPEQLNDVTRLASVDNPGALHYFREAVNSATPSAPARPRKSRPKHLYNAPALLCGPESLADCRARLA